MACLMPPELKAWRRALEPRPSGSWHWDLTQLCSKELEVQVLAERAAKLVGVINETVLWNMEVSTARRSPSQLPPPPKTCTPHQTDISETHPVLAGLIQEPHSYACLFLQTQQVFKITCISHKSHRPTFTQYLGNLVLNGTVKPKERT